MQYIDETTAQARVSIEQAIEAVRDVFVEMAARDARNFPVVREDLPEASAVFGFKSGYDPAAKLLGVKAGGYWKNNRRHNLANHQSSVLLFDHATGELIAVVAGNYLTAIRTAAASALSIELLARDDVKTLSVIGAGKQAEYQIRAACKARQFSQLLIANRTIDNAERLKRRLSDLAIHIDIADFHTASTEADAIITIASSFSPLVKSEWIKPGVHIAAMGTDTKGKCELDPAIFNNATAYTDEPLQSASIGEAQHAIQRGILTIENLTPIGAVAAGTARGRSTPDEITIFDGTGVGLQDLAVAKLALVNR